MVKGNDSVIVRNEQAAKRIYGTGVAALPDETITEYEKKYFSLLQKGREENKKTTHRYAKQEEQALLNRLEKYSHNHLLFLHDFSVPFDDNISERDLRKAKKENGFPIKYKEDIYGHSGYILVGIKPVEIIDRLNCYEK